MRECTCDDLWMKAYAHQHPMPHAPTCAVWDLQPSGLDSGAAIAAKLESGELQPTRAGRMELDLHVEALAGAAQRLRDAELEVRAAQKAYGEALQAFNRFVAPVPG